MTQLVGDEVVRNSSQERRGHSWLANVPRGQFWWLFAAAIFFNFGFSAFYFLFNIYLMHFGATERLLGLIGSLLAVGSILGTIPVGIIAQRYGLRATLMGGILLAASFSMLRAYLVLPSAQLVLAVCCGLIMCFWAVCLSPAIAGLTSERERPVAFGLMFASGIGVTGLGAFTGGRLPGWLHAIPFHHPLNMEAPMGMALILACGVTLLALLPISRISLRSRSMDVRFPRFSNPFLRRFLPAIAVWSLVTGSFVPFANVYFVHHLHFTVARAGTILSVSNLAQFFAMLGAPILFRKAGFRAGIMLTQFASAAAVVILAITHTAAGAEAIYWIYVAVQCMNEPGIYNLLMDRIPVSEHNGASAATFLVSGTAQAVASLAMGLAIVHFGYPAALIVVSAFAVLAAVMFGRIPSAPEQAV